MSDVQARLPRQLRIALAMKGGVSLAVWMGGACCEIARLVDQGHDRADQIPGATGDPGTSASSRYRALLELCGYDSAIVDVLSGSSAGGLNGVLLSQHIATGAAFGDGVRNVWLTVGDLHQLARRPLSDKPLSLLHGDRAFYPQLLTAMDQLNTGTAANISVHPLRLLVTATRLHGRPDAVFPMVGAPLRARSSAGFFRFRHPGIADANYLVKSNKAAALNDFIDSARSRQRLAYAARTTSSFPGAFEPAAPYVMRYADEQQVNMYGVSSETGTEDEGLPERVELVDGGVLDNIPIAWAIRSIAGMPAMAPVDRWLIYLEPVPAAPEPEQTAHPGAGRDRETRSVLGMIKIAVKALRIKSSTESVLDDAQVLREAAATSAAQQAALVANLSLVGSDDLLSAAESELVGYIANAGQMEAARLRQLLIDPFSLVAPDPLPVPTATFAAEQLEALHSSGSNVAPLLADLSDNQVRCLVGALTPADLHGGMGSKALSPLVAARAVTLLFAGIRAAENAGGTVSPALRQRLYSLRLAIEMTVAVRDRLLLKRAGEHLAPGHAVAGHVCAVSLMQDATRELCELLGQLPVAGDTDSGDVEAGRFWQRWAWDLAANAIPTEQAEAVLAAGKVQNDDTAVSAPYAQLWDAVIACVERIPSQVVGIDPANPAFKAASVFSFITAPPQPDGSTPMTRAVLNSALCALEVLVGSIRPDPLSNPSVPRFAVMSATNGGPLEKRLIEGPVTGTNRVSRKLSGNQVANFAGFLSARWRHNDWIWGRLDGAQTLVSLIARADRIQATLSEDSDFGDRYRSLRRFFTEGAQSKEWADFYAQRFAELTAELETQSAPDVPTWVGEVATERLQWDILAEEMTLFGELNDRGIAKDEPPDLTMLKPQVADPPSADTATSLSADRMRTLGAVGEETVLELLGRAALRRTIVQLGLTAWRATIPSLPNNRRDGEQRLGKRVQQGVQWFVAPLLFLPLLLSLVTPWGALGAGVLSWFAVSTVTGAWGSRAHVPIVIGLSLVTFALACHGVLPAATRMQVRTGKRLAGIKKFFVFGLPFVVLAVLIAGLVVLIAGGWHFPLGDPPSVRGMATGILTGLAFLFTLAGVLWASFRKAAPDVSSRVSPLWVVVVSAVVGLICGSLTLVLPPTSWSGLLIQYLGLALSLLTLYAWVNQTAVKPAPEPNGQG